MVLENLTPQQIAKLLERLKELRSAHRFGAVRKNELLFNLFNYMSAARLISGEEYDLLDSARREAFLRMTPISGEILKRYAAVRKEKEQSTLEGQILQSIGDAERNGGKADNGQR